MNLDTYYLWHISVHAIADAKRPANIFKKVIIAGELEFQRHRSEIGSGYPVGRHTTLKQRNDVWYCIEVDVTLYKRRVPAGCLHITKTHLFKYRENFTCKN